MNYKTKKINQIFKNDYIEIQNNRVENTYNNNEFDHIKIIENNTVTPGSAVICEYDKKYFLIKSYRYGVGRKCWEIPRGYREEDETLINCAIREIYEESNISKSSILSSEILGMVDVNSAMIASSVAIVLLRLKEETNHIFQKDELIVEGVWLSISEIQQWIQESKIVDSFSLCAFMLLFTKNEL